MPSTAHSLYSTEFITYEWAMNRRWVLWLSLVERCYYNIISPLIGQTAASQASDWLTRRADTLQRDLGWVWAMYSEPGVRLGVTGITVLRRWESSVTSVSAERRHNTTLTCRPCQKPSITCTEIFWPDIRCILIPNPTKHKLNPTKCYAIDMRVSRLGPVRQWAENMAANYPWPGSRHYRFWIQTAGITWSDSALRVWTMSVLIPTAMDIYLMKMTRLKAAL